MNGDSMNNWRPAPQAKEVVAEAVQHSELKGVACGGGDTILFFFCLVFSTGTQVSSNIKFFILDMDLLI